MTADHPELLPDDRPGRTARAVTIASDPPPSEILSGVVPVADVAPSLVAVAPEPVVTASPGRPGDRRVVDALERLREALVAAEGSLDRVAATVALGETDVRVDAPPARPPAQ